MIINYMYNIIMLMKVAFCFFFSITEGYFIWDTYGVLKTPNNSQVHVHIHIDPRARQLATSNHQTH